MNPFFVCFQHRAFLLHLSWTLYGVSARLYLKGGLGLTGGSIGAKTVASLLSKQKDKESLCVWVEFVGGNGSVVKIPAPAA